MLKAPIAPRPNHDHETDLDRDVEFALARARPIHPRTGEEPASPRPILDRARDDLRVDQRAAWRLFTSTAPADCPKWSVRRPRRRSGAAS